MSFLTLLTGGLVGGSSPSPTPTPTPTPSPTPSAAGYPFDPDAAGAVVAPGWLASSAPARPSVRRGDAIDLVLQARYVGGAPASFAAGDTLAASIYQRRVETPACTPSASFYTAAGLQTGYDQGQLVVSLSDADAATLQPTGGPVQYRLVVTVTPAAASGRTFAIARLPLVVAANS